MTPIAIVENVMHPASDIPITRRRKYERFLTRKIAAKKSLHQNREKGEVPDFGFFSGAENGADPKISLNDCIRMEVH